MLKGVVDICASPHTYKVIDAITHALTSTHPKERYVIGWDSRLLWVWVSRLPTRVGDVILELLGDKATPETTVPKT
jgi:retinol dehydrogenase-16